MQRSAVLLILTTVLALVGLAPTRAESAPARGGYGVGFYGPHIRFGIGFHGYRYYPRFSYRYSRPHRYSYYRANPYYSRHYYRPELYVGAYPSATYVPYRAHPSSQGYYAGSRAIRMRVDAKEAQVFVDGYYAGIVDDFDGTFQKLYLQPGEHTIELRLEGHRTFTQRILASPSHTQKLHHRMELLGPGDGALSPSAGPPAAATPVERRPGAERGVRPRTDDDEAESRNASQPPSAPPVGPAPEPVAPSPPPPSTSVVTRGQFGVLRLHVQPAAGEIRIDGEPWGTLGGMEELSIHLPAGIHRIELHRAGTSVFATDVEIRGCQEIS